MNFHCLFEVLMELVEATFLQCSQNGQAAHFWHNFAKLFNFRVQSRYSIQNCHNILVKFLLYKAHFISNFVFTRLPLSNLYKCFPSGVHLVLRDKRSKFSFNMSNRFNVIEKKRRQTVVGYTTKKKKT